MPSCPDDQGVCQILDMRDTSCSNHTMDIDLTDYMRNGVILMDGGTGHGLVPEDDQTTIPALHREYIAAGARVIKTGNCSFGNPEPGKNAATLAWNTRDAYGKNILIAGCLPAPDGDNEYNNPTTLDALTAIYRNHVRSLDNFVDVYLCDGKRSSIHALAAATAASSSGKPVWVSWKLKNNLSAMLQSGETLAQAWQSLQDLPIGAVLVSCCDPESVTAAMPDLKKLGAPLIGAYANGFSSIARKWTIKKEISDLGHTRALDPDAYARHVRDWIDRGAGIVGGCCGVSPAHIARINELIEMRGPS